MPSLSLGNIARSDNPTLYRTPIDYCQMLHQISSSDKAGYKIIRGKSILTYIQVYIGTQFLSLQCHHLLPF